MENIVFSKLTIPFDTVNAASLPMSTLAQQAELSTLTWVSH